MVELLVYCANLTRVQPHLRLELGAAKTPRPRKLLDAPSRRNPGGLIKSNQPNFVRVLSPREKSSALVLPL